MAPYIQGEKEVVVEKLASKQKSPFYVKPRGLPRLDQPLADRLIDEPAPLRVAIIGAGIAGLQAGIIIPRKVPGVQVTIFEKNADVSGTWFENIYPGVRADVPVHSYQASYDSKTDWTEEFAQGPEIKDYWRGLARKYGLYDYTKFGRKITSLDWDEQTSTWTVSARNLQVNSDEREEFDFVVTAIGRFNAWKLPDYPGIADFKGHLRHTSNWDPNFDHRGKRVAVIGNGASGIQLVANIQPEVVHLDHYARNKTWIAKSFAGDETSIKPKPIPQELQDSFNDPDVYLSYRQKVEETYWKDFTQWIKGDKRLDDLRQSMLDYAKAKLPAELLEKVIPDFEPHCRRLTPGPGYFEAITADNVSYIQTGIKRFTETGVETVDGVHREVDAVLCATGANVDMVPPFPIRALGQNLPDLWREGGAYGFPFTYLGLGTPGFPNLLYAHSAFGVARGSTLPYATEIQATAIAKILRKVSTQGIKALAPKQQATIDFCQYADAFFNTTVLSQNCSSWYNSGKAGSRIHGLWPGSAAHMSTVLRDLRWEDWEYDYKRNGGDVFLEWLGKGWTAWEEKDGVDFTGYLKKPGDGDVKGIHEDWWTFTNAA